MKKFDTMESKKKVRIMPHSTSIDSVQRQLPIIKGIHLEAFLAKIVITWDCC